MATYYLRTTGSDGAAGTSVGTAWATFGKALGAAGIASGDTLPQHEPSRRAIPDCLSFVEAVQVFTRKRVVRAAAMVRDVSRVRFAAVLFFPYVPAELAALFLAGPFAGPRKPLGFVRVVGAGDQLHPARRASFDVAAGHVQFAWLRFAVVARIHHRSLLRLARAKPRRVSITAGLPTFAHHVGGVLRVCSNPQVIWAHARGVVYGRAVVAENLAVRDGAVLLFPKVMVCLGIPAFNPEPAVPVLAEIPGENPTGIGFVDFGPEAGVGVLSSAAKEVRGATGPAAKPGLAGHDAPRRALKRCAALFADTLNGGSLGVHLDLQRRVPCPRLFHQREGLSLPQIIPHFGREVTA
jgi:hypothetical protein